MTKMIHKSVEARRARRNRYVNAIKPICKRFGCTAAQAAGIIQGVLLENEQLKEENARLKQSNMPL